MHPQRGLEGPEKGLRGRSTEKYIYIERAYKKRVKIMRHKFKQSRCAICRIAFREGDYIDFIDLESGLGHAGCVLLARLNLIKGWATLNNEGKPNWKAVSPEANHYNKYRAKDPELHWGPDTERRLFDVHTAAHSMIVESAREAGITGKVLDHIDKVREFKKKGAEKL